MFLNYLVLKFYIAICYQFQFHLCIWSITNKNTFEDWRWCWLWNWFCEVIQYFFSINQLQKEGITRISIARLKFRGIMKKYFGNTVCLNLFMKNENLPYKLDGNWICFNPFCINPSKLSCRSAMIHHPPCWSRWHDSPSVQRERWRAVPSFTYRMVKYFNTENHKGESRRPGSKVLSLYGQVLIAIMWKMCFN